MINKKITISTLGNLGRFGNQLFQVCTGIALARKFDVELQIPADWIGRQIFNIDIPAISSKKKSQTELDYTPDSADFDEYGQIDLLGYWQYQDALSLYSREDVLNWLPFQDWILDIFPEATSRNREYCKIVIHKRSGDYLSPEHISKFCTITEKSYYKCLYEKVLVEYPFDQKFNISEVSESKKIFNEYCEAKNLGFLPDFMEIVSADVVIRSNSTFSFWGSILGANNAFSPVVEDLVGWNDVDFVKGNYPRMVDNNNFNQHKITDLYLKDK